jgi:ABC-type multidrug transport system ATPase subunit
MLWNLTVRETMLFAAKLRLPQSIPLSEKVCIMLDQLPLESE